MCVPILERPIRDRRRRIAGFTLIELLVVIAIIAILVSVLMPALSGARKSGQAVLCQSRLRTLGKAMQMYADAYDFFVPLGESDVDSGTMHYAAALLPGVGFGGINETGSYFDRFDHADFIQILGNIDSFQCPAFPDERQRLDFVVNAMPMPYIDGSDAQQDAPPGDGPLSQANADRALFRSLDRLKQATSRIVYLTEAHAGSRIDTVELHDVFVPSQLPFGAHPRIASDMRHPGGINSLFYDSHVAKMPPQRLGPGATRPLGERLRYFSTVAPRGG